MVAITIGCCIVCPYFKHQQIAAATEELVQKAVATLPELLHVLELLCLSLALKLNL